MINKVIKTGTLLALGTPFNLVDYDAISPTSKTAAAFANRHPKLETGKQRLYSMFSVDEFGTLSPELTSICQSAYMGFFTGAVFGGFVHSREAYMEFMESNQATAFKSHLDAKRKLQNEVTVNFAKGAVRWGWRLALFTTSYVGIVTTISVYRGKSSVIEYFSAGALAGSIYKFNSGLRGMAAGGLLGCGLGGLAGVVSLLLLRASGTSMEEVRYWQYNWKVERDQAKHAALLNNTITEKDPLLESRTERDKENTLENIKIDDQPKVNEKVVK